MQTLLLFANVSQPPLCNALVPAVRALQGAFRVTVVEPIREPGFVPASGVAAAVVPERAVIEHTDPPPDVAVCIGEGLHFSDRGRRLFRRESVLAGFTLSDPYGLAASFTIAPEFDLFYTQDPQTIPDYASRGIVARRCDPATDPELYRPLKREAECDILHYGKWTPYRDAIVAALAVRFRVRVHAYAGEKRWSVPARPPLDTPEALNEAINRARLVLEIACLDDGPGKYRGSFRITSRAIYAASCGVPVLVEPFGGLSAFFDPGAEAVTFASPQEAVAAAEALLNDEPARLAMGRRARQRVLRDHTWQRRVEAFLMDLREARAAPRRSTR